MPPNTMRTLCFRLAECAHCSASTTCLLAVNAVIAKLSLMTAVGGLNPSLALPVQLDLGTNNEGLLRSTFYTGLRQRRLTGYASDELMNELIRSIETRFGVNTMLFFEDMQYRTAMQLLSQYGCASCTTPSGNAAMRPCRLRPTPPLLHGSSRTGKHHGHAGCASRALRMTSRGWRR